QIQIVNDAEGNIVSRELLHQRHNVYRRERGSDATVGFGAALHTFDIGREIRVGSERLVAYHMFGQYEPFAIVLDRDQHVAAVAGLEGAVGRDRSVRETDA